MSWISLDFVQRGVPGVCSPLRKSAGLYSLHARGDSHPALQLYPLRTPPKRRSATHGGAGHINGCLRRQVVRPSQVGRTLGCRRNWHHPTSPWLTVWAAAIVLAARRWHEWHIDWSALQAFMVMGSLMQEVECGHDTVLWAGVQPSGPHDWSCVRWWWL